MQNRPRETPHLAVTNLITGHFRKNKGYANWRPHGTQDWLLIYTVAGRGRFGYSAPAGSEEFIARPGDVVILRPNTLHDYGVEKSLQHWNLLWAHFQPRPHWIDWLNWPPVSPHAPGIMCLGLPHQRQRDHVRRTLAQMHQHANSSGPRRLDLALHVLEEILLTLDSLNPLQAQSHLDPRIRSTMDFLCAHIDQKITLHHLAERVNLSESRLAHLFRKHVGLTPQRFLELQRLDRAKQLLALTPTSIKEIAYQVGFQNPFYFTLRFKRYTSKSPKAYRQSA